MFRKIDSCIKLCFFIARRQMISSNELNTILFKSGIDYCTIGYLKNASILQSFRLYFDIFKIPKGKLGQKRNVK